MMDGAWLRGARPFGGRLAAAAAAAARLLVLWWCVLPRVQGADSVYSVTLSGVGAGYQLNFSSGWNATVLSDTLVVDQGGCQAGTYCPAGGAAPLLCPGGYWCGALVSVGVACDATYTSAAGARSAADCSWRIYNVSVDGVGVAYALNFSTSWNVSVASDTLVVTKGSCGAGTYCPYGTWTPLACPAAYYCNASVGAPAACPAGFTSLSGGTSPSACNLRWFNVTFFGVASNATLNWTANLPAGWLVAVGSDQLVQAIGGCPAGRWCPGGSAAPVVCPLGSYSAATGQTSAATACNASCAAGNYCPDPGRQYPCPTYTSSPPGSVSQLGCACVKGFICRYRSVMQVTLQLGMSIDTWLGDAGLRSQALLAVATAARVSAGSVQVANVVPLIGPGGAARRRLLAMPLGDDGGSGGGGMGVAVRLSVAGAEDFDGVEARLAAAHPRLRGARAVWRHGSRVRALHRLMDRSAAGGI